MKQFLIDLGLVFLLICVVSMTFGNHQISRLLFDRSIDQFEEKVATSQEVGTSYVTLYETQDNQVALFFKEASEICVHVIEFIVLIFSDLISLIF